MKFTLHRKPDSKAQKIPFPAMQIAGLAGVGAPCGRGLHSSGT